ncbi:MAG: histidine kinase N-terminal 7TM domain-containing protein [Patescibacteria group bacterium]|jgi:hypothetical protein
MAIQNYILIVESALLLVLSLYVLLRNPGNAINRSFAVFTFGASVWVFSNATDYVAVSTFLLKLTYIGAILIAAGLLYFSIYFPFQQLRLSRIIHTFITLPGILLSLLLIFTPLFIDHITGDGKSAVFGPIYHVFNVYFIIYWIIGATFFIKKYRIADGLHRWQLKMIFWAMIFSLVAGIITNLILPWVFDIWTFGWVGPMFSIIYFGFTAYILFKKDVA